MFNQKSVLARLLANENITVQQGNYETAYFDVKSRTLGLPLWKDMGKDIYDMLVGHEVAHALYTPENFFEYDGGEGIPHTWLNIVEDVRIEKLVLRTYPGLVGNFKRAYTQLMNGEDDLFGIRELDIATLGFMDRLNIHAKARDMIEVPFADDELPYVAQVKACETYEDVVKACQDIQAWLKEKSENQQEQPQEQPASAKPEGEGQDDQSDEGQDGEPEEGEGEGESQDGEPEDDADGEEGTGENQSPAEPESGLMDQEVLTETNFAENVKKLKADGAVYAKGLTRAEAYASIVSHEKVAKGRRTAAESYGKLCGNEYTFPEDKYSDFLRDTKQIVNLMVKEFEMRKTAWRSLRARESTKGTIDVNKLHKYQYDDMLFKQVNQMADAKNHGMVMLIDYSGSMHRSLPGVLRQTLTLLMFCKRVGIPFEVYSFTSISGGDEYKETIDAKRAARPLVTRVDSGELAMLKLFDSSMTKREYEEAFRMTFWQADNSYIRGLLERLGNTPLNTALMAMQYIVSDFQKKHRVQKMNLVTLTDGDSNSMNVIRGTDAKTTPYGNRYAIEVNGKMVEIGSTSYGSGRDITASFVNEITKTGVTTINYFIASRGYELKGEISRSLGYANKRTESFKAKTKDIRDSGVAVFDNNGGYSRRFVMESNKMVSDVEDLNVTEDMTIAKIAKAFTKSNGSKKKSKIVTQKFAEMVA